MSDCTLASDWLAHEVVVVLPLIVHLIRQNQARRFHQLPIRTRAQREGSLPGKDVGPLTLLVRSREKEPAPGLERRRDLVDQLRLPVGMPALLPLPRIDPRVFDAIPDHRRPSTLARHLFGSWPKASITDTLIDSSSVRVRRRRYSQRD